jgi:hypothetical protein
MKIGLCYLSIGEKYKEKTKWGRINKINYCKKHNYTFIEDDNIYDKNKTIPWSKIHLLLKYINDYDYLVWMDADLLIMNNDITLESYIEKYNNYDQIIGSDWIMPNTGCWFIKNTEWSKQFLNQVLINEYNSSEHSDGRWNNHEQGSVINLYDRNILSSQEKIKITYPTEFNCYWFNYYPGHFILHFAGSNGAELVENLLITHYPEKLIDENNICYETDDSYNNRMHFLKNFRQFVDKH